jgi:2-oxoglutarate dehydrogenase E2 component (dihydrolipoamide succinyltransferase)
MSFEVKIPAVGESITSGLLSTWHKNDGDAVKPGDVLLTLETDKVSTEIAAEKSGLLRIKVPAGQEVKIGEVVGTIDESASAKKTAARSGDAPAKAVAPLASPASVAPAHTMKAKPVPVEKTAERAGAAGGEEWRHAREPRHACGSAGARKCRCHRCGIACAVGRRADDAQKDVTIAAEDCGATCHGAADRGDPHHLQ